MKPYPWKCAECRERAVSPTQLPEYRTTLEHDGRSYEIVVKDLDVLQCAQCGEVELPDAAGDRLVEALRREAGILSPDAIRAGRIRLCLSQKQLAAHLKVSEYSLSRWETGAQMQQRAMDLLLRAAFALPSFRRFVGMSEAVWSGYSIDLDGQVARSQPAIPHRRDDVIWSLPADHAAYAVDYDPLGCKARIA